MEDWTLCVGCYESRDPQRRFEQLMDELVKLANLFDGRVQNESKHAFENVTTTHGYFHEGKCTAYWEALSKLQEVMRNA